MKPFAALVGASALLLSQPRTEAIGVESTCRPHLRRVEEVSLSSPLVNTARNSSVHDKTPEHYAQPYLRGSSIGDSDEAEPDDEPEPETEPEPEGEDEDDAAECTMENFYERNAREIPAHTSAAIHGSVTATVDDGLVAPEVSALVNCVVCDVGKPDDQAVAPGVDADIDSGDDEIDGPIPSRGTGVYYASHMEDKAMGGAGGRRQPARESWQLGGYRSIPSRAVFHERYLMDPYSVGGDFILDPDYMGFTGRRGRGPTPWAEFRRW